MIMDRLLRSEICETRACPAYKPVKIDYKLTTAKVFRQFIVKLMHGSVGIRAITLIQRTESTRTWKMQTPGNPWKPSEGELPSWVPNLADRGPVSLSIRNIFTPNDKSIYPPSLFPHPRLNTTQRFHILGDDLHAFGRRLGQVVRRSEPFPSRYDHESCGAFWISVSKVLNIMPVRHYSTNTNSTEELDVTLGLGWHKFDGGLQDDTKQLCLSIEHFIAHTMSELVCHHMYNSEYKPTDELLAVDPVIRSAFDVPGISSEFLLGAIEKWRSPEMGFHWRNLTDCLQRFGLVDGADDVRSIRNVVICAALATRNHEARGQSVFALAMNEQYEAPRHQEDPFQSPSMFIGMGSGPLQEGDEIWVLQGSELPFILRPRYTNNDADGVTRVRGKPFHARVNPWWWRRARPEPERVGVYELVGDAYVHGIMDGELFKNVEFEDDAQEIIIR